MSVLDWSKSKTDVASVSAVPREVRCGMLVPLSLSVPNYDRRCRGVDGNVAEWMATQDMIWLEPRQPLCVLARIAPRLYRHRTEGRPSDACVSSRPAFVR